MSDIKCDCGAEKARTHHARWCSIVTGILPAQEVEEDADDLAAALNALASFDQGTLLDWDDLEEEII